MKRAENMLNLVLSKSREENISRSRNKSSTSNAGGRLNDLRTKSNQWLWQWDGWSNVSEFC